MGCLVKATFYRHHKRTRQISSGIAAKKFRVFLDSRPRPKRAGPYQLTSKGFFILETCAAVDGPVILGYKRDLGGGAALCAHGGVHFALAAALVLAAVAAVFATHRLVLEALLCVEFLFTNGEDEISATILANQYLFFEHENKSPLVYSIQSFG